MAWKKTPPELLLAFEQARPQDPRVESRRMFGFPAHFVNGNMFAGTFEDKIVLRLPGPERQRLLTAKRAKAFEPMAGRPMQEYVVVPPAVTRKRAELASWIARAFAYAAKLPAKGSKTARRR